MPPPPPPPASPAFYPPPPTPIPCTLRPCHPPCALPRQRPNRVIVVGGGYIAIEFAGIFKGYGAEVTRVCVCVCVSVCVCVCHMYVVYVQRHSRTRARTYTNR